MRERNQALFGVDDAWLQKHREEALEPDLAIVDPHHHLWDRGAPYLFNDYLADIGSGHNICASVFVQCDAMYRVDGDPDLAPVGETEFVNGIAAMSASGAYGSARVCAGIVGFAELRLGDRVDVVLEAHLRAAGDRFKGIRGRSVWDADPTIKGSSQDFPKGLLLDAGFRRGYARLVRYNLSFDAWLFHPQLPELADLAGSFPDTPVVLDHIGAPLAVGVYAGRRDDIFVDWKRNLTDLARRPNVSVKLGGLAMHLFGFDLDAAHRPEPADSEEIARLWRPYIETCIEIFGVERCMFESNFPVDKRGVSYGVLWNAFKRIAAGYSASEKAALFRETACRTYRLVLPR
ncbi:amidohydrolase family protein [Kaistia algarum]|nr:amidohydrolase family protein [Kaistia algarum]